jgi:hypothetical protein
MTCKKHPSYKVMREPKSDCVPCWIMWLTRQVNSAITRLNDMDRERQEYW